ncbi:hypothetical protein ANCDUO_25276, partial [Ancylostoma duodenale]
FRSEIGQRVQLSEGDIRQAKKLYKCAACGDTLLDESADLIPSDIGKCVWRIIAAEGQTIFLNLTGTVATQADIASFISRIQIKFVAMKLATEQ